MGKRCSKYRSTYKTIASLLDAQPKALSRDTRHRLLWDYFLSSQKLQRLRISQHCYRILHEALVMPHALNDFYKEYALPNHPFFPLFLAVKHEWFEQQRRQKEQRERDILKRIKQLPGHRRHAMRILAEYERIHHPTGDNPVWENRLFPATKKRAEEMMRFTENQWYNLWCLHLTSLSQRYRNIPQLFDAEGRATYSFRILATLILRCREVNRREINRNFRHLCMEYHPDYGGDKESFFRAKMARDVLLGERIHIAQR